MAFTEEFLQRWRESYKKSCRSTFESMAKKVGMNDVEIANGIKWLFGQHEQCHYMGRPCAGFGYGFSIEMTQTNVGIGYNIHCSRCNCEKDVTDYESW